MELTELIIDELKTSNRKMDFDELVKSIGASPADLRSALGRLVAEGKVIRSPKGKLFLPGKFGFYTGRLDVKRSGYGFLLHEQGDIFIPADKKGGAMNGDLVVVRLLSEAETERSREGVVTEIIQEKALRIVGTVVGRYVSPDDDRLDDVFVSKNDLNGARTGQKVVVELKKRGNGERSPEGRVTEVLGTAGDADVELKSLIRQYDLPEAFPADVEAEAQKSAGHIFDTSEREDLRGMNIFTIDGADAKDLDDAVSVKRLDDGYELGVHIADVAQYVKEGSRLDKEAFKRGTSVYLADTVIPMLPEALSNGACSLSEGTDKLTLSCFMKIDEKGNVLEARVAQTVIRSKHRLTYGDVNKIFAGGHDELEREYADILSDLLQMRDLAAKLRARREEKGSIDFEIEETAFRYDAAGRVIGVGPRARGEAERLIEEFMLAANKSVAEMYYWRDIPFVYRIHEQPDEEKMRAFAAFYENFGKIRGKIDNVHPKMLQGILEDVKGKPHENIINQILLRSLKKAEYSPECKGHFGLSFPYYCHFTSPIRRYPDLAVHRIIKRDLNGRLNGKAIEALAAAVEDASKQSSLRERAAMEAERAVDDMKKAEYMFGKEGMEFEGIISGVSRNVLFVQLDNTVEGVIPLSSLQDDYYVYIEKLYCVIGERTRRKLSMGDEMRVRVESVSVYPPRIEFTPVP